MYAIPLFLFRLAESRTNPQVLDIGVNPQDINTEECLSLSQWDQAEAEPPEQKDTFSFWMEASAAEKIDGDGGWGGLGGVDGKDCGSETLRDKQAAHWRH